MKTLNTIDYTAFNKYINYGHALICVKATDYVILKNAMTKAPMHPVGSENLTDEDILGLLPQKLKGRLAGSFIVINCITFETNATLGITPN